MQGILLQFIVTILAGWVHRGQQQVVDYLIEENRVLREQLGKKRLRLTNEQRRRLAVRAGHQPEHRAHRDREPESGLSQ